MAALGLRGVKSFTFTPAWPSVLILKGGESMWSLLAMAGGFLLKSFTFETVKYVALRAMLIAVILGLGPIVLLKGFTLILDEVMSYSSGYVEGQGLSGVMLQMTGIAAFLAEKIKIPEGISVFLSFLGLSFVLRMIKVK